MRANAKRVTGSPIADLADRIAAEWDRLTDLDTSATEFDAKTVKELYHTLAQTPAENLEELAIKFRLGLMEDGEPYDTDVCAAAWSDAERLLHSTRAA